MLKKICFIFALSILSLPVHADEDLSYLGDGIKKVSDDYYVGKLKGRDLWAVMERVNKDNINDWQTFADIQSNSRVTTYASRVLKEGKDFIKTLFATTGDGAHHFKAVLKEASYEENEMWIAYITSLENPKYDPNKLYGYRIDDFNLESVTSEFARHLKMYVTVTSSPDALITSHMGITFTAESTMVPKGEKREKGLSVPLHAFAAKVMKSRNDERRYMVNAPAHKMERIITSKLPEGTTFIGTREKLGELKAAYMSFGQHDKPSKEFLAERPPIIYYQREDKKKGLDFGLTLFEPGSASDIYLHVNGDDEDYNWLKQRPFLPAGSTHYLAVDLEALANAAEFEADTDNDDD